MGIRLWRPDYEGSPPTWRVQLTLREKCLEHVERRVGFGDQPADLYRVNPRGQVPALEDDGVSIHETHAILQYLEHVYPEPRLLPVERRARAVALTRVAEVSAYLMSAFVAYWQYRSRAPVEARDPAELASHVARIKAEWRRWEGYLEGEATGWLAGETLTLADLSVFPYLAACVRNGLPVEQDYPALAEYHARMRTRRSVCETWPTEWDDRPGEPLFA